MSYKGITVVDSPQEVIKQSNLIFLCVKPHDIYSLIEKNQLLFKADQCLVSITSPIQVAGWRKWYLVHVQE